MRNVIGMALVAATLTSGALADGYQGVPRTFLWNPGTTEIVDAAAYAKKGPYVVGFSNASISNPWRVAMLHGIEAAAERHAAKLRHSIAADASDPSKQAADVQDLIAQGVDILLISPATAETWTRSCGAPNARASRWSWWIAKFRARKTTLPS